MVVHAVASAHGDDEKWGCIDDCCVRADRIHSMRLLW